ncbi:carboxypeptidase-like regulatory domain-containing protein [Muricauda sp. MAR_2010_75]|uniref:carboxypeptidase-like regulatory domain-containing protein n=1 Tax=Allomuricauda sp. MAR_2010_75 TaxID=1250232 RepID=UPI000559CE82|nr:carboxypeptidase-like regulatory domain-containing protein [Muricauda sp. MAR_2010_75]
MQKTTLILLILTFNLTFSQSAESEFEFRKLTGNLVEENGQPFPGQIVMIKGTEIGTTTDFDGNFCLTIPQDKTVFIELPFCFDQIFREIKPTDNTIELKIGKGKRKSKKATRSWIKVKTELNTELNKIYNSTEYKTAEKNICR